MAEGDAESRELPLCAPHAGYSDEEEAYTETKAERNQYSSEECLYREQEVRLMQNRGTHYWVEGNEVFSIQGGGCNQFRYLG